MTKEIQKGMSAKKLPGSLQEWLAGATEAEKEAFVKVFNATIPVTEDEVAAEEKRQAAALAAMSPEEREAFHARMTAVVEKGRRLVPFLLKAHQGDGRTWRCLKEGCGGALQLNPDAKAHEAGDEVWKCLLCGKHWTEFRLVQDLAERMASEQKGEVAA